MQLCTFYFVIPFEWLSWFPDPNHGLRYWLSKVNHLLILNSSEIVKWNLMKLSQILYLMMPLFNSDFTFAFECLESFMVSGERKRASPTSALLTVFLVSLCYEFPPNTRMGLDVIINTETYIKHVHLCGFRSRQNLC